MEKKINLLCKAMSEILDNQLKIMKHFGLITTSYEWGDGCDNIRSLSAKLCRAGQSEEDYHY